VPGVKLGTVIFMISLLFDDGTRAISRGIAVKDPRSVV